MSFVRILSATALGVALLQPVLNAQEASPCPPGFMAVESTPDAPRPRLTRGSTPANERAEPAEPEVQCVQIQVDFITMVRQKVGELTSSLPNFICQQLVYRAESNTNPPNWRLLDRLSAEVMMVDGRETYEDIRRDGEPIEPGDAEETGQWSRGEFASLLVNLFSPNVNAEFVDTGTSYVNDKLAARYEYEVPAETSRWQVRYENKPLTAAYGGTVWIDQQTYRVLRVEMQARDLPDDYPTDVLEMSVDYGPVEIADREYLLPVQSENLACWRGSRLCDRNTVEFRNYRRFSAETTLTLPDEDEIREGY